jgi:hypothetical protein
MDRSISIVTMAWTTGVRFPSGKGIFLFVSMSKQALRPAQPSIQRVSGVLSAEVKLPGCNADHSPPHNADVKNER